MRGHDPRAGLSKSRHCDTAAARRALICLSTRQHGYLIIVRLQCNRTRRRWLSRLRNPNAIRAASLMSRLFASVPAFERTVECA